MKNKSFENYYDHVHVDEHLLDQKKSYKHHYLKPILILSCCLLLSVCVLQSKQINKDTFEVIAYNQTYTSLTKESTPMDYYLIHDRVDIADKVQLKKKYEADISFIGSTYQEKCAFNQIKLPEYESGYAMGIIEAQLKVYGIILLKKYCLIILFRNL